MPIIKIKIKEHCIVSKKNEPMLNDSTNAQMNLKKLLTDSYVLGFITILGYACCYYFQVGYYSFFHVPHNYIEIDISKILKSVIICLSVLAFGAIFYNALSVVFSIGKIKNFVNLILFIGATAIFSNKFNLDFMNYILLVILIPIFIRYLFIRKTDKKEKLFFSQIIAKVPAGLLLATFFLIAYFPFAAEKIGLIVAKKEHHFLLVQQPSDVNMIVIGTYKENMILEKFDKEEKKIIPDFKLIKAEELVGEIMVLDEFSVEAPRTLETILKSKD